ncbi:recombination and repair protein [Sulfurifustis variabilis]|uniref:DNA repair protein RecN n=1 Tax=Sulfurifustis variabilis TaxID=1675686 RepID=A0A1B4VEB6_9GAMM|nr:DNA repair protein RecN [Sulfurifustis variabilis]BAU48987.1 recombination and repair protein [Sulfurifustis variabilis]
MLGSLYVRDIAIVKGLDLEFGDGLTVLTGETGAGKSILIDALALVLGGRADAGIVRPGAGRAEVSASFALAPGSEAAAWLEAHELAAGGDCVLRRVIERDRPSKGFINGRPVPIQMLRELGEHLVDIHGQHEHQSLLRRDAQRQILDDYAGLADALAQVRERYDEIRALEARLQALKQQSADRGARLELLQHQVKELEALALKPDEIPEIEEEHSRLANGAELLEGAQSAVQALYEDDESSVSQLLAKVTGRLEGLAHFDARLGEAVALLNEAGIRVDEAASRLHHYLDGLELDPGRLQWLEARLGAIHDLARKHRLRPEELPALLDRLRTELADVEDIDGNLARLESSLGEARKAYADVARRVSRGRKQAATRLARAITERMQELGMGGGRFEIELAPLPDGEIAAHGVERIEFLVTANPGLPLKPLAKVASGGELSRISLALQVVTARLGRIPTLVFDEVDVGVGGRVAEIVGRELRTLGANRQVLCITHLPQVAALGQHHLQAAKLPQDGSTVVEVKRLKNAERVQEIARMLGGLEISKKTIAHAQDMLARAAS